jgi:hypothetical protein
MIKCTTLKDLIIASKYALIHLLGCNSVHFLLKHPDIIDMAQREGITLESVRVEFFAM